MKTAKEKKKKKRAKKLREQKHHRSIRDAYFKKYPELIVRNYYANIDLVHEIEDICRQIDFRNFDDEVREKMKDHKTLPAKKFMIKYAPEDEEVDDNFGYLTRATEDYCEYAPYIQLEDLILLLIYKCLEESGSWAKYMPIHNVIVRSYRGDFVIIVNSFHQHHSSFGKGYYTDKPIYVEIPQNDGSTKKYRVAMSIHALKRVFERTFRCSLTNDLNKAQYPIFLYQFGLYNECRPVKMDEEWGAAIYATYRRGPDLPHSLAHKIAYEILDRMEGFKILCGYCPIGFCKDEFVHFKTLLAPGMRGTPEEKVIRAIENTEQREKYEKMVADVEFTDEHMKILKLFQNAGYHVVEYLNEDEKI